MIRFNKNMLGLARELRSTTQGELAVASGLSQTKVSKIEAGLLVPTEEEVKRLSDALHLPIAFFGHDGPRPARGSTCLNHRKKQSARVRDLNRVHAQFAYLRLQIEELLAGVQINASRSLYQIDVDAMDGDVEHIAEIIRQTWGVPPGPVENLTTWIEHAGAIVVRADIESTEIDAMGFWPDAGPPVIFVNAASPGDRLRFSLAHELGHLVMHAGPIGDIEKEANRFAAEFLMPRASILPELASGRVTIQKLAALKIRWKVSVQSLVRRAHDLSVITDRQYRSLMMQISKMGWRTSEPVRIEPEQPTVLSSIVNHYLSRKGFTLAELSTLAISLEPEFCRQYFGEENSNRIQNGVRFVR
ncbi:MAG: ImmA/IrrE family metallo-endopeptidase [Phycisphaerales bacterium]|nr:ImmA/IrrE family metallo-endopeptidase [Phycisphaerales bacterium]